MSRAKQAKLPFSVEPKPKKLVDDLKHFICQSPDIGEWGKRAVLYLIDHSERLSKSVCLIIPPPEDARDVKNAWDENKLGQEASYGVHDIQNSLYHFCDSKGIEGHFCTGSMFGGYFFISFRYSRLVREMVRDCNLPNVRFDKEAIDSVVLPA